MGIANGQTVWAVYTDYLKWFRDHAKEGILPKQEDELVGFHAFHEDSFDDGDITLNRMFFLIPLFPSQTRNGRLEVFAFSELNLMVRTSDESGCDKVDRLIPVEYRIE